MLSCPSISLNPCSEHFTGDICESFPLPLQEDSENFTEEDEDYFLPRCVNPLRKAILRAEPFCAPFPAGVRVNGETGLYRGDRVEVLVGNVFHRGSVSNYDPKHDLVTIIFHSLVEKEIEPFVHFHRPSDEGEGAEGQKPFFYFVTLPLAEFVLGGKLQHFYE